MYPRLLIILGLSANLCLIGCADDQARAQIADTNVKLTQLQSNVGVLDNKVSNQKLIDILNKLDNLQSQIDQLNGNVATVSNNQKNYQATQDQLYQSIEQQIQDLQRAVGQPVGAAKKSSSAPAAATSDDNNDNQAASDNNQLKSSLRKIKAHNFPAAIKELKSIINNSQDDDVVTSATYYLTVSYAANGQYKEAIELGRKFATNYPQNQNAPDALRTVYISQKQLGMKQSAAKTANFVVKNYPNSDAAKKIQAERKANN